MKKADAVRKLTSRKLWLSIANFVSMLLVFFNYSESTATQVASLIMAGSGVIGYLIAEGLADGSPSTVEIEDDQPMEWELVTGQDDSED